MAIATGRHVHLGLVLAAILGGAIACGGASPSPQTVVGVTPASSSEAARAPGPPVAWVSMNKDQKKDYMKASFSPKMKSDFIAFDAQKYAAMNCATCHGDGAKDGSFTMPNPGLPKLSFADGFKKHMDKTPEMTKFMMNVVVPDSAALVGQQPYDPKTKQGFGCMKCHTPEM